MSDEVAARFCLSQHVWIPVPPEAEAYIVSTHIAHETPTPDCEVTILITPAYGVRWCGRMRISEEEFKVTNPGEIWRGQRPRYWDDTVECWRFDEPGKNISRGAVVIKTVAEIGSYRTTRQATSAFCENDNDENSGLASD